MAARRRTQNIHEKRAEHEAYERQQAEEEDRDDEEEDEEDESEEEEEAPDEEGAGGGDDEELGDEEEAPPKKKKKPVKEKAPKKSKPRSSKSKVSRMKLVWKVFNNSNQPVASYEFRQRAEAEEHAARLTTDKKSTHFVQGVKEAIEEKKEA